MNTIGQPLGASRGTALLWFAFLGGPAAWTVHLLASYPLVRVACRADTTMILHAVTVITVLVAVASGAVGWREWRRLGELEGNPSSDVDLRYRRARFMAISGALLGGFFAVVTLAEGLPAFFGDPCLRGP